MARLKARLDKLEAGTPAQAITARESRLLVSILARRDALFWPWRFTATTSAPIAELRRRQREYLDGTVGIAAKADGRQQWKDAQAMRQNLIAAGHIIATHSSGQVQSVFLTALGEATARRLVGDRLHTFDDAKPLLEWMRILSQQTAVRAVRESMLFMRADLHGCPNDWDELTEMVLPLLTSGVAIADTDTVGRVAYAPTDAPEPPTITVDVETDPDLDGLYIDTFNGERSHLQCVEPRDQAEIFIPLPASGWGWPCHFPKANFDEKK